MTSENGRYICGLKIDKQTCQIKVQQVNLLNLKSTLRSFDQKNSLCLIVKSPVTGLILIKIKYHLNTLTLYFTQVIHSYATKPTSERSQTTRHARCLLPIALAWQESPLVTFNRNAFFFNNDFKIETNSSFRQISRYKRKPRENKNKL